VPTSLPQQACLTDDCRHDEQHAAAITAVNVTGLVVNPDSNAPWGRGSDFTPQSP